jgi:hydroxyacylglutathione hydrolase
MGALQIYQFPCLSDNFGVLIHDPEGRVTASIDAPEADKVSAALAEKGWKLTHILTTHHHADHTGGNARLKAETGCRIIGPRNEAAKIPGIDEEVGEGDTIQFGAHRVQVLDTPGHTAGQVNYFIPSAKAAFCGDTLFAMGCGRMFEGTAPQMWASLRKLRDLPPETRVYCGHEYTQNNARFALTVEPGNAALKQRALQVDEMRSRGAATIPSTIAEERATNPFFRADEPAMAAGVGLAGADPVVVFAEIRRRKDAF